MKLFKKDEKEKMLAKIQLKKCFFLKNFVIGLVVMVIVFFIGTTAAWKCVTECLESTDIFTRSFMC